MALLSPPHVLAETRRAQRVHDLLGAFDAGDLEALLATARAQNVDNGGVVFRAGDVSDCLYIIQKGRVKVFASSASGNEVLLNVLVTGEVFGEIALMAGKPHTVSAQAQGSARLLSVGRCSLLSLIGERPELAFRIIETLCCRLRTVSKPHENAMWSQLPQQLAKELPLTGENCGVREGEWQTVSRRGRASPP
jgi:CRP-like cAMP-binding protein